MNANTETKRSSAQATGADATQGTPRPEGSAYPSWAYFPSRGGAGK